MNDPLNEQDLFVGFCLFQFIGISNTNYGNRVNESKTADSRNSCEIIDELLTNKNDLCLTLICFLKCKREGLGKKSVE